MAQRTQKAIREGFLSLLNDMPFDKISVLDIAERSDINRNTFYYYYADIFALVDDVLQTETKHIRESSSEISRKADRAHSLGRSASLENRPARNA